MAIFVVEKRVRGDRPNLDLGAQSNRSGDPVLSLAILSFSSLLQDYYIAARAVCCEFWCSLPGLACWFAWRSVSALTPFRQGGSDAITIRSASPHWAPISSFSLFLTVQKY